MTALWGLMVLNWWVNLHPNPCQNLQLITHTDKHMHVKERKDDLLKAVVNVAFLNITPQSQFILFLIFQS